MGNSQSQQSIGLFERDYIEQVRSQSGFFGRHALLINRLKQETLIKKQFVFERGEYKQFMLEFEKIERKPFNLIYPKLVIGNDGFDKCGSMYEVNVYMQFMGRNLAHMIKKEGRFNESRAWFLLNEISKSLQIMGESGRAHWAVSAQTVFENSTHNYFLYDSLFVLGFDPHNYLKGRVQKEQALCDKVRGLVEKGAIVGLQGGYEQDMYALGLVMLFVLTGKHPNSLPKKSNQRQQAVLALLTEERRRISRDLIDIIEMLTERESAKRMDCYQLRRMLKEREAEIIHNQNEDFQHSKRKMQINNREKEKERRMAEAQKLSVQLNHYKLQQVQPLSLGEWGSSYRRNSGGITQYRELVMQNSGSGIQQRHVANNSNSLRMKANKRGFEQMNQGKLLQVPCQSTTLTTSPSQINLLSDRNKVLPRIQSFDRLMMVRK